MRKTFEQLVAELTPIVIANAPDTCSIGKGKEIAEDCAYLIRHGYSINMTNPEKRAQDEKTDAIVKRAFLK